MPPLVRHPALPERTAPIRPSARRLGLAVLALVLLVTGAHSGDTVPTPPPVPAYRAASQIAVLTIEGAIDRVTLRSLERRVERALAEGADAIVLDINTPGGEVVATRDIVHLIRQDCPPNTVAWVNPNAYSAGTIISLACREIVVAPDAAFGDAAPITLVPLPDAERDKQEAPLRAEVVASARRNHYDENLVQAFISVGIELWLIEQTTTGQRIFVTRAEYERVFGEAPPDQMPSVSPPDATGAPGAVQPWFNTSFGGSEGSMPEPMTDEEMIERIELQQSRPSSRPVLTEAERGKWRLVTQVVTNDRLLSLKPEEAMAYGLSRGVIANDAELAAFFGASGPQAIIRYDRSWSESMVRFLVSWPVRIVLIVIFLLALFIELAAPGVGVFGATSGAALLVLIGAPYLAGMAQWWDILFIVGGLVLLAMEVLVVPGFGVAGVGGAILLLVGLVGTFVSDDVRSSTGQAQLVTGILATVTAMFGSIVGMWIVSRHIHTSPLMSRLVLSSTVATPAGPRAAASPSSSTATAGISVGDIGIAETDLRPAGRGRFGDRLVDIQSLGSYIEKHARVRVVSVGRYVIEVEEAGA